MDATLTIRLPEEIKQSLDRLADATGRTKSYLALDAIQRYLEQEAWQVAEIQQAVKEADAEDFATPTEVKRLLRKWGLDAD
jgi:predicted transcriptional regulator